MAFNTLTFGDFDPVTGAPTLDGLTAIPEAGLLTSEAEPGYVQGGRLTFGSSSGFPPVVIDAVRDGNFLQLGVFCRFDLSFDIADTIVVALKPTPGAGQESARAIHIHPVFDDIGADEQVNGSPANAPDDVVPGIPPSSPASPLYHIRMNHPPAELVHFHGIPGGWTKQVPNSSPPVPYVPLGVGVKVRSWTPPVAKATDTPGGAAQALPPAGGVFNVLSTAGFPSAGLFEVVGSVVRYTGKTVTSFTGCTGGSGNAGPASPVRIPEVGWSAELRIPTGTGVGGPNWIDLAPEFGLFVGVIRAGLTPASGSQPVGGFFAAQHLFPTDAPALTGTLDETLDIASYGTGLIPSEGATPALGVRILNGELGIGARLASSPAFSAFGNTIDRNNNNVFVTQVENTDPANPATAVTSEVRIANWGMPPATFAAWARPLGATPNPSNPQDVTNGTPVELTTSWNAANIPIEFAANPHQCIWVQLSSGAAANFTSSSDRRNMDFAALSAAERDAEISGVGYPAPHKGNKHQFLLIKNSRAIELLPPPCGSGPSELATSTSQPDPQPPFLRDIEFTGDKVVFLTIVHGYRLTGKTLRIGERTFQIVDPGPGSFGFISEHRGDGDALTTTLSGRGLTGDGNIQVLEVPHDGTTTIHTRVEAAPPKPAPDDDDDDDGDDDNRCERMCRRLCRHLCRHGRWEEVERELKQLMRRLRER
jgi:hypothetical protein